MTRATKQQTLISTVFEAAERASQDLTHLVPSTPTWPAASTAG
ncbi:hypothetical protein [Propioniciclava sinopodophylli]|nr:hypothetical protein [Propioniciclava sinopodophylli]